MATAPLTGEAAYDEDEIARLKALGQPIDDMQGQFDRTDPASAKYPLPQFLNAPLLDPATGGAAAPFAGVSGIPNDLGGAGLAMSPDPLASATPAGTSTANDLLSLINSGKTGMPGLGGNPGTSSVMTINGRPTNLGGGRYGGGGLTGASPRDYNPASGGVPGVTNPIDVIGGNLGGIGDIISSITGQQGEALRSQYPTEYFGLLGTLLGNTQRRAGGDISDLLPELQQGSAERAVSGGFSGSGMENTKLLRDLGLTRYGVENKALDQLGQIQAGIPTVRPYDPSGAIRDLTEAQERADLYAAAPNPEAAYQRAMEAANVGYGGGGGGRGGGPAMVISGGGGGVEHRPYSGPISYPRIGPQYGTAPMGTNSYASAPYGSYGRGGGIPGSYGGAEDNFEDVLALWNDPDTNFGGGQDYGGGAAWEPLGGGGITGAGSDLFTGTYGGFGGEGMLSGGGGDDFWNDPVFTGYDDFYDDYAFNY
jgi:hypothetical protein